MNGRVKIRVGYISAKPQVLLENKVAYAGSHFTRPNVLEGIEAKNMTVSCVATGGKPAPNLEITVNKTTIDDIDFSSERKYTAITENDNTVTGKLNTFSPEFLKRTLPVLNLDTSIVANRGCCQNT